MTGKLLYDYDSQRLCIKSCDEEDSVQLHCGMVIEVRSNDIPIWTTTRVEANSSGEWYLVGLYKPGEIPAGMEARQI